MMAATSTGNMRLAVIDFSAFLSRNMSELYIKELTVADVETSCVQHWIFKRPKITITGCDNPRDCDSTWCWRSDSHNNWLSRHFHGFNFEAGDVEYADLRRTLEHICDKMQLLYAPSAEKSKHLEKLLFNKRRAVFNLESFGCPPISHEYPLLNVNDDGRDPSQCLVHCLYAPGFYCTRSSAVALAKWCRENPKKIDMNDALNREKTFAKNWKLTSLSPKQVAEQGFVLLASTNDNTKCVYCSVVLHNWEEKDDAEENHEYNSPFCKFVRYRQQQKLLNRDDRTAVGDEAQGPRTGAPSAGTYGGASAHGTDSTYGEDTVEGFSAQHNPAHIDEDELHGLCSA